MIAPPSDVSPLCYRDAAAIARRQGRAQRGAALITTLVAISVMSLLGAGIAAMTLSHFNRAEADADAAKALDLAECAAQYQMQRLLANLNQSPVAYNGSNLEAAHYGTASRRMPLTGKQIYAALGPLTLPTGTTLNHEQFLGINTAASPADYCEAWVDYATSSTTPFSFHMADDVSIYGEARIGGIRRRVRFSAKSGGLFDKWALFGNSSVTTQGSVSITPVGGADKAYVAGNGVLNFQKSGSLGGQVIYGTGTPDPDIPFIYGGPKPFPLPSVNELADRFYKEGGYANTSATGVDRWAGANDNLTHGYTSGKKGATSPLPANGSVTSGITLTGKGAKTPANFYSTALDGSGVTIYADVTNGPINLWIKSSSSSKLTGQTKIIAFTQRDSKGDPIPSLDASRKFHIYYSNPNTLQFNGGGDFYAMLHNFNRDASGNPFGHIDVQGNVTVNGTIACNTFDGHGNFTVFYPQYIGAEDYGAIYFGRRDGFQEVTPVRGN